MTSIQIVALYAGLNLLLLPVLMMRVGNQRVKQKVSTGDGGNQDLFHRIRAHANFTETAPFALIGLYLVSLFSGTPAWLLHLLGGGFTFGRIAHAHGMAQENALGKGRTLGAVLSLLSFIVMGGYLLFKAFTG